MCAARKFREVLIRLSSRGATPRGLGFAVARSAAAVRLQFFGSLPLPKQCSAEELSPLLLCCRPSLQHRVRRAPFSRELANTPRHRCRARTARRTPLNRPLPSPSPPPQLPTPHLVPSPRVPGLGKLQGAPDAYDMSSFFAIPYAEPPVEALRWQPPKELTSWGADTLNATAFGKQCMQGASFGAPPPMDEDCLFLNVATPTAALSGGKKLPVMLWIHGGACERRTAAASAACAGLSLGQ
eukprot:COSAG06_NODE_1524_length_9197_cov_21.393430_5_plen_240_part_00